jgi:alanyl-tRNA synthetase
VVNMGGDSSVELWRAATHLDNTAKVGLFKIVKESSRWRGQSAASRRLPAGGS